METGKLTASTHYACREIAAELTAANARIAELKKALADLHDAAGEYAADQSGATDPRCGITQPVTVEDAEALNHAINKAAALLEKKP
jgi:hypothetical protein